MSAINLVILGQLKKGTKSAYEMKKELESENIMHWVKISIPSIYQNLIKLHQQGMLDAQTVKEGEMPEKTIYSLNEQGNMHFHSLMQKYSAEINSIFFDFSAFVVNLDKIDPNDGLQMIAKLQAEFKERRDVLERQVHARSNLKYNELAIIKLYSKLFTLLYDWSEELRLDHLDVNELAED